MACPSKGETLLVRAKTLAQSPLRAQSVRKGPAGRGNPRTWRFHREQRGTQFSCLSAILGFLITSRRLFPIQGRRPVGWHPEMQLRVGAF
jgi:hypothetical protein